VAIAVEEMKFCTAAAELCNAGTMLCAPMRCFAERKKNSIYGVFDDS